MSKLILIGAGGHSKVIQDIAASNGLKLYAIVDDAFEEIKKEKGIIYANPSFLDDLDSTELQDYKFCISVGNNVLRKTLFERLRIPLGQYAVLIHPSAVLSSSAKIGFGTVVMPNAVINADTVIGNHCIINSSAVIEHDNTLGDYVHVSPRASLCGTVSIGEGTHIGAGAVIIPGKRIGSWSTVGAGAAVVKDVGNRVTVAGVPARNLQ